jgi:hypothetical protein
LVVVHDETGTVEYLKNHKSYRHHFKYCHRKHLHQCVEGHAELQSLPDDGDQHVDRHGDPYLWLHGILGGPIELLDPEVLLDPLEEKLRLPRFLCRSLIVRAGSEGGFCRSQSMAMGVARRRVRVGEDSGLVTEISGQRGQSAPRRQRSSRPRRMQQSAHVTGSAMSLAIVPPRGRSDGPPHPNSRRVGFHPCTISGSRGRQAETPYPRRS